jgi:hypothetical protein
MHAVNSNGHLLFAAQGVITNSPEHSDRRERFLPAMDRLIPGFCQSVTTMMGSY